MSLKTIRSVRRIQSCVITNNGSRAIRIAIWVKLMQGTMTLKDFHQMFEYQVWPQNLAEKTYKKLHVSL